MSTAGKLTLKQEKFCMYYAKGEIQSKAYELAGYTFANRNTLDASASGLLRLAKIQDRIAELQREFAAAARVTVESISNQLSDIATKAAARGNEGAAVQALGLQAKLHGFVVDRKDVVIEHKPSLVSTKALELSREDWQAQFVGPKDRPLLEATKIDEASELSGPTNVDG